MNHMLLITAQRCGLGDSSKVAQLVRAARMSNRPVMDLFLESGELNERSFLFQLSQNLMIPWWEPEPGWSWPKELAGVIPREEANRWQVVVIKREHFRNPASQEICLASYQPVDEEEITRYTNRRETTRIRFHITTRSVVCDGLKAIYELDGLAA